jgi:hypothetical protein
MTYCGFVPQVHGQKAVWEDPVEWVRGTLPWPSAQQDQAKLFHLPPPSMTSGGPGQPSEASARPLNKETPPSSMDTLDPLVRHSTSHICTMGYATVVLEVPQCVYDFVVVQQRYT